MRVKAIVIIALLAGIFKSVSAQYKLEDKVSDFKLKNVDNKMVSLADYKKAKGFIVVFTCNHCPFAKAYEQRIMDLDKKYVKLGYPVIAISPNDPVAVPEDDFASMQALAKEKGYTFPYLIDETQSITKAFGATKTPHVFILQKTKDQYVLKYIGAIDDNSKDASAVKEKYVENALSSLLAGKEIALKETKAIGCGVKWKAAN